MKKICFLLLSAELFLGASAFAASPEIQLSGRKDRVLSSQMRTVVLDVAKESLDQEDESFVALYPSVQSPYTLGEAEAASSVSAPAVVAQGGGAAPVVYGDASILRVVSVSFAKQVRGTLARGSMNYLQLQGGSMLKSGTSFPAKIPQLAGQSFTVTISDIHSRGYTLKLGDASQTVPFDVSSGSSADATTNSSQ
jgi:hypothetical protein